jgi:hypothetical protein
VHPDYRGAAAEVFALTLRPEGSPNGVFTASDIPDLACVLAERVPLDALETLKVLVRDSGGVGAYQAVRAAQAL